MDSILITTWSFCLFFLSSLVTWNRCLICILLRSRSVDRAIANMLCGRISAIEAAVAAESATFDDTEITVLCCIHSGTVARCLLHDTGKCTYSIFISIISVSHSRISDSCRYRWMPSYECPVSKCKCTLPLNSAENDYVMSQYFWFFCFHFFTVYRKHYNRTGLQFWYRHIIHCF